MIRMSYCQLGLVMSTSNNKEEYTQTNIIINAGTTLSRKP